MEVPELALLKELVRSAFINFRMWVVVDIRN